MTNQGIGRHKFTVTGLALMLLFSGFVLINHDGNPGAFIFIGYGSQEDDNGGLLAYDGLTAYYIAADPLHAHQNVDPPAYRYLRILYPILTWLISLGGDQNLIPWVMLSINVLSTAMAGGLMGHVLAKFGLRAWHGLFLLFSAGMLISVRANLNEPLAILFALLGIALFYEQRWVPAGICFACGILSKEIALPFALGAIAWLLVRRQWREGLLLAIISILPAVLWGVVLTLWLGESPLGAEQAAIEIIPFNGLRYIAVSPAKEITILWVALPALLFGLFGAYDLLTRKMSFELFMLLASIGLVASMPVLTWINASGALRTVLALSITSLIYTASRWPRGVAWVAAFWMTSGLIMLPMLIFGPIS